MTQILLTIPDVEIIAYCDNYPKHLEEAGNMIGPDVRGFSDYREVFDNVNLVYTYPSGTHLIYDSC